MSPQFKPNTVYVIYIGATPEKVWEALTSADFTRQYFFGHAVEIEPREGGRFLLRTPDGRDHITGRVVEWNPPRRLSVTWKVESMPGLRDLPECLVTYDIAVAGDAVRLTLTEAHSWDIPEEILSGGRTGWPAILSSLKSVIETGKPLAIRMEPPKEMLEAVKRLKR